MKEKNMPIVAMIYDFDGTLAPKNMQEFGMLNAIGYDKPSDFWNLCDQIAKTNDAGSIAVVMYALQAEAKRAGIPFTRERLRQFGQEVSFFPGVLDWFDKINAYAAQIGIQIKHYINSSGIMQKKKDTPVQPFLPRPNPSPLCWALVCLSLTQKAA